MIDASLLWPETDMIWRDAKPAWPRAVVAVARIQWFVYYLFDSFAIWLISHIIEPSSAFEKFSKSNDRFFAVRYIRNILTAYYVAFFVLSESFASVIFYSWDSSKLAKLSSDDIFLLLYIFKTKNEFGQSPEENIILIEPCLYTKILTGPYTIILTDCANKDK